jgi:DNA-binding LacI/PurR family transcriptional regulator
MQHNIIGILVPYLQGTFNGSVVRGIQRIAADQHYRTISFQASPAEIVARNLATESVDLWVAATQSDGMAQLVARGTPVVGVSCGHDTQLCANVMPDNHGGTRAAVEHLLGHGHTQIAFIGYPDSSDHQERYQAYCAVLREHGIEPDPRCYAELADYTALAGAQAFARIRATGVHPSALFAAYDVAALGAMQTCAAVGLRIPEDLAIIGFDDDSESRFSSPPLTSVRQRWDVLGEVAATHGLAVRAGHAQNAGILRVPTQLVIRESCGCA